jgi:outer membrane protein OmpA-like peptidoglycan-associated protein
MKSSRRSSKFVLGVWIKSCLGLVVLIACTTVTRTHPTQSIDYANLLKDSGDVVIHRGIVFDYNASHLLPEGMLQLDTLAEHLMLNPRLVIEIGCHSDERGAAEYNLRLTEMRAKVIVSYLQYKGINESSLIPNGYGESRLLLVQAKSEGEHSLNRRVEFKVVKALPK